MHASSRLRCQNCDNTFHTYECANWNVSKCRACKLIHRDDYYIEIIHTCPKCRDDAVHLVPDGSMLQDIRKVCQTTEPNDQDTFWTKLERKWWWAENEEIAILILNALTIYGDEAYMMTYVEEFLQQIQLGESLPDDEDPDFAARF
jgi:hypothetical protein